MTATDETEPYDLRRSIAEITAAIVLSAAALLTTWASFQAALWDGEQAASYTRAGAARVEAGQLATARGQDEGVDLLLFTQWLDAYAQQEDRLQAFYRTRFRPEFGRAFDAWLKLNPRHNPAAPPTPFAMREYVPRLSSQAAAMDAKANALFEEGQRDNETSDAYVQATVIFALALFLGGIGQTFHRERIKLAFSGLSAGACLLGVINMVTLPVLSLGP